MDIAVLLVASEGEARDRYEEKLQEIGVEYDVVSSLASLFDSEDHRAYQGILLDVFTTMKADREEKLLVQLALDRFPTTRVRWDPRTEAISTLYYGQRSRNATLEDFIKYQCKDYQPSGVRTSARVRLHFNTILSRTTDFRDASAERSVTLDISRGGAYLFSGKTWKHDERINLVIKELKDPAPIPVVVKRIDPWGEDMRLPGVGISFLKMTSGQQKRLFERIDVAQESDDAIVT